ncbi:unnamed protein product [Ostreobium quekettii]|uniref:Uncharacterized protein n=1 Tax=Ostreobium quekettii TaxID=121088 RepID=A0A8S1IZ73_9CHLO|nr:unnamed protein product [Ostreobium quekettii]
MGPSIASPASVLEWVVFLDPWRRCRCTPKPLLKCLTLTCLGLFVACRVRGRGEYKYHRSVSRSPGRWGDGSPSHARSMSRSVSRSITPRRKRARHTRSRSYSRSRSRGWSPRYGRDRRRYSRGYKARSRSRSDPRRSRAGKRSRGAASPRSSSSLGNSFTSGASNDSRKMAKAVVTNTRKDLLEAKKREQQLISRVAALEADVKKGQGAKEAAMARVEAMSSQVKAVGERSKNRGAMLAKLVEALKSVEDLRGRVKDAECFLEDLTQSAIDMMQEEEREFEREEQVRREAERLAAAQRSLVEQNPAPEEPSGKPTENGVEKLDPPDSPDANDDARQTREGDKSAEGGQGWRRPLTFKFNL